LFTSALIGWLAFITAHATWVFLIPHPSGFGRETEPFLYFATVLSFFYAIDFILIAVPFYLFLHSRRRPVPSRPTRLLGGALLAILLPASTILYHDFNSADLLFIAVLAFIAGFAAFAVLPPILIRDPL
jgi:hypothetical protein